MILINNHWEMVTDIEDVSRVIREYYNPDLADELDKIVDILVQEVYSQSDYEDMLEYKNDVIDNLNYQIDALEEKICELEEELDSIREE